MLEMAVLGLLKDRTMHGYELKKELTATLGQFWQVSYGSLYPTIRRLEVEGAVERIFPKLGAAEKSDCGAPSWYAQFEFTVSEQP